MRKVLSILWVMVFATATLYAQNTRTVTGKVTDDKGAGLSGVTVSAVGAARNAVTDNSGNFSITVPTSVKKLKFSYVGFGSEEVSIGTGAVNASLKPEDESLNEVVVVGYGTQKKKDYTGSTATVKGSALANRPVQSFDQALGGRAAGVQVNIPNGVVNAPPVIRIRGINSISLSSFPLVVIDGVPTFTGDFAGSNAAANPLSSINPNDIESVDIAKDAAATAIYGSRAANGVLFVTTKKGSKSGKAKVSYDGWVGWTNVFGLPKVLDAFQYTDYKNEALVNAGTFSPTNQFRLTNGPNGQPINTNWYDVVYRQGVQHSNTVNVTGGNEATQYYFSVNYTEQQGILRRNDFKKLGLLMNVDHKANKYVSLGGKLQYSNSFNLSSQSSGSLGDGFSTTGLGRIPMITAPNIAPFNNDGTYNLAGNLIGVMGNLQGQVGFSNPQVAFDLNRSNSELNQIQSNFYLQIKPFEFLTLKSLYAIDYVYVDNEFFAHPLSSEGFPSNGSASSWFNRSKRWVWTNTAQFAKSFKKHNTSLLVGVEQQKTEFVGYGLNRQNVNDPAFTDIQGGWATPNTTGLGINENYLYSQFASANYNYDRKYFFAANVRRDGASQLGINNKFGTFWGLSAGWEIANENFFTKSFLGKTFSSLRFRASHGKVGNIAGLGNYASLSTFSSGLYGGTGTVSFSQAGNPDLGWETSTKTDVGFNFGFLKNRITGEVTWYQNDINGLILNVPQPPSAGLPNAIATNVGTMFNRGWESQLNFDIIQKKDFSWRSTINYTYNWNMVTSLAPGLTQIITSTGGLENPSITRPGYSVGQLFVTRSNGVDPATGRRIFINGAGQQVLYNHVGAQFRFADGSVAPRVGAQDAVVYANTLPRWTGGWDNTFRYKNFDLNLLFTFQFDYSIYFGTNAGLRDQRFWNNSVDVLRRWQKAGDITDIPRPVFGDNQSNGSAFPLDINVFNGDFIKLRNLMLGYSVPTKLLEKVKISSARFYVQGSNLFIFTKYPGPDPEVSSNGNTASGAGIDRNTIGNARTITVGLNIGF